MRWMLLGLILLLPAPAASADQARLVEAFDRIVFGTGLPWARSQLLKIDEREVRIDVFGAVTAERMALLEALTSELSELTGMAVQVAPVSGPPEPVTNPEAGLAVLQVHLVEPSAFPALLNQSWIPQSTRAAHARSMCSFVTRGRGTIRAGLILINANLQEETVQHCLVEEIAQSFGALDDSDLLDPSAFNDWGSLVDRLQPDDRRILEALYDPRLSSGMTRAEVMALLPEILLSAP